MISHSLLVQKGVSYHFSHCDIFIIKWTGDVVSVLKHMLTSCGTFYGFPTSYTLFGCAPLARETVWSVYSK